MCLVMWRNRSVTTELQNIHMNFTNILCIATVTACCAVSSHGITGRYCSENAEGHNYMWIQCGTKSCWKHFSAVSYILVSNICCGYNKMEQMLTQHKLPCKSERQRFWADSFLSSGHHLPVHLPDLAVSGYFFWGYVKSRVCKMHPANIADLQRQVLKHIEGIPKEMLQCVMTAFPSQLLECNEWHGGHLQSVIFEQ